MKKETYSYPKSSFLSLEKDMELLVQLILKNERLKKLLYYPTKDCLSKPNLTEDQTLSLFNQQIKIVPKLRVDSSVLTYLVISFDNFVPNGTNPEFRDNIIKFDIVCHFDQWQLKDFALRPFKIAAEIDSMLNQKRLTGIGKLEFLTANKIVLTDKFIGICLMYSATHGEEDKKNMLNPYENEDFIANFNAMFNE